MMMTNATIRIFISVAAIAAFVSCSLLYDRKPKHSDGGPDLAEEIDSFPDFPGDELDHDVAVEDGRDFPPDQPSEEAQEQDPDTIESTDETQENPIQDIDDAEIEPVGQICKTFDAANFDLIYSIIRPADGGFIFTGQTNSLGSGDYDILVVKVDSSFTVEWANAIGGSGPDYRGSIIEEPA
jgi:hypothetical protein